MKYQIAVSQISGGYVGKAVVGDNVMFTSNVVSDPINASRQVAEFIKNSSRPKHNFAPTQNSIDIDRSVVASKASPPAPTRCCGRG